MLFSDGIHEQADRPRLRLSERDRMPAAVFCIGVPYSDIADPRTDPLHCPSNNVNQYLSSPRTSTVSTVPTRSSRHQRGTQLAEPKQDTSISILDQSPVCCPQPFPPEALHLRIPLSHRQDSELSTSESPVRPLAFCRPDESSRRPCLSAPAPGSEVQTSYLAFPAYQVAGLGLNRALPLAAIRA
jgi:hypothetical protein